MSVRFGILAEDATDCDALATLVKRFAAEVESSPVGVNKHSLKGCSRLRKKARAKLADIARDGCIAAILVHDLDRNPENNMLNRRRVEGDAATARWLGSAPRRPLATGILDWIDGVERSPPASRSRRARRGG
jgi:uncharacterized membrane protein